MSFINWEEEVKKIPTSRASIVRAPKTDYKILFVRAMKLADKYAGTKKQRWKKGCTEADYLEWQKLKEAEP